MDKLKCSRCKNEELTGTENYCPICGIKLKITALKNREQLKVKSIVQDILNCLLILVLLANMFSILKREKISEQLQIQVEENKLVVQKVNFICNQVKEELGNINHQNK